MNRSRENENSRMITLYGSLPENNERPDRQTEIRRPAPSPWRARTMSGDPNSRSIIRIMDPLPPCPIRSAGIPPWGGGGMIVTVCHFSGPVTTVPYTTIMNWSGVPPPLCFDRPAPPPPLYFQTVTPLPPWGGTPNVRTHRAFAHNRPALRVEYPAIDRFSQG